MAKLTLGGLRKLREAKQTEMKRRHVEDKDMSVVIGMGTCGIAAGAKATLDAFAEALAGNRELKNVAIRQTGCMGLCYAEPTVEILMPGMPAIIYGNVDAAVARKIVHEHVLNRRPVADHVFGKPAADIFSGKSTGADSKPNKKRVKSDDTPVDQKQIRIVLRNCGVIDPESIDEYIARDGYQALEKVLFEMKPEQVLKELEISGLRGRGGAGFPTWKKWSFCRDVKNDQKYMICNADEGDPGAFMDRATIEGDPHSILEAMTIAGRTIGASQGFVYIRAEYPLAIRRLEVAIEQARAYGLLGGKILGSDFNFDIELRFGAGAFVCGEETALIASIEGKRGMPSPRPPFPAVKGLWGKPTVINNVETLANIPVILMKGGTWFAKIGTATSKGTKVFALTGKIKNSGLIEVPMGTTLREIIFDIGGGIRNNRKFKAAQTGGPSGGVIPAQFLDTPIDYETLSKLGSIMGSGGLIVMDEDDCMVDVNKFYLEFTVDESCGKCAPCRIGSKSMFQILERITAGNGADGDIPKLLEIGRAMQKASLCGLGQTASNPVVSTLRYFQDEYQAHIRDGKCPAGKCKNLVHYLITDACIGCGVCARKCPVNCITGQKRVKHVIDQAACIKCGECYKACKFSAITRG